MIILAWRSKSVAQHLKGLSETEVQLWRNGEVENQFLSKFHEYCRLIDIFDEYFIKVAAAERIEPVS